MAIAGSFPKPMSGMCTDLVDASALELEHRAVYRLNRDGSVVEVTHDCEKPNGIALSRDLKWLYLADHNNGADKIVAGEKTTPGAMKIYAYPLGADGLPNGPKQVLVDYGTEAGCDGLCIDKAGNIYLTARGLKRPGVQVLDGGVTARNGGASGTARLHRFRCRSDNATA